MPDTGIAPEFLYEKVRIHASAVLPMTCSTGFPSNVRNDEQVDRFRFMEENEKVMNVVG